MMKLCISKGQEEARIPSKQMCSSQKSVSVTFMKNTSMFWIELSGAGFKDFLIMLLNFLVPVFLPEILCARAQALVESIDNFPALSACISQVEPALLLPRAFVSVDRTTWSSHGDVWPRQKASKFSKQCEMNQYERMADSDDLPLLPVQLLTEACVFRRAHAQMLPANEACSLGCWSDPAAHYRCLSA